MGNKRFFLAYLVVYCISMVCSFIYWIATETKEPLLISSAFGIPIFIDALISEKKRKKENENNSLNVIKNIIEKLKDEYNFNTDFICFESVFIGGLVLERKEYVENNADGIVCGTYKLVFGEENKTSGVSFDNNSRKIARINNGNIEVHDFDYLIAAEAVIEQGDQKIKSTISPSIGGAILGGVLAGGVGALIGAGFKKQSGKMTQEIKYMGVNLVFNDLKSSTFNITILHHAPQRPIEPYAEQLQRVANYLSVIIHQNSNKTA